MVARFDNRGGSPSSPAPPYTICYFRACRVCVRIHRNDPAKNANFLNMTYQTQSHSRFSVLSTSSLSSAEHLSPAASSTRFSLPSVPSVNTTGTGPAKPPVRPNIYDRNLNKTRTTEVSAAAFAFLISEVVQYTQKRVTGITDLERRYSHSHLNASHILRHPQVEYPWLSCWNPHLRVDGMA